MPDRMVHRDDVRHRMVRHGDRRASRRFCVRRSAAPLLIFANKQDLPCAASTAEIVELLDLRSLHGREWYIQGSSATTGEGIYEGIEWLAGACKRMR